jgi:hypothetical protein
MWRHSLTHPSTRTVVVAVAAAAVARTETSTAASRSFVRALELARRDGARGGVGADWVGAKP